MFKDKKMLKYILIYGIIAFGIVLTFNMVKDEMLYEKVDYSTFMQMVDKKEVKSVNFSGNQIEITPSDNSELKGKILYTTNPAVVGITQPELIKDLTAAGVGFNVTKPENYQFLGFLVSWIFPLLLIFVFGRMMFSKMNNKMGGGVMSFGKNNAKLYAENETGITFKDVAGQEEAKESLVEIVDFLHDTSKYVAIGAKLPKGALLVGPPGTGKTLLAKAVAGEAKVPFFSMSGSDFVEMFVGMGAARVRDLFKQAEEKAPCIVFIDEIDAIGKKRSNSQNGNSDERDQTLNALLTEMSGFNESEGIVVIAATNRLDMLDDALLRPGRFDRHIEVNLPDISAREKILSLYCENKPVKNFNIKEFAQKTACFSGAKLENLVNEAAILACKENSQYIENIHFEKAFSIILAGYEKQNRDFIDDADKKITAFHEAGHALVSMLVLPNEEVSKVTIIPSSKGAGGYTLSIPEDKLYKNKKHLNKKIMVLLAGRAAEELTFGRDFITTGAHNDLKQCTNIVFHMVTQYGMGNSLGLLNLEELMSLNIDKNNIILECKSLVDSLYIETKQLLTDNISILKSISEKLLEKETLYSHDLKSLCN